MARTLTDALVDSGRVPDPILRASIRALLRRRLAELEDGGVEAAQRRKQALVEQLRAGPVTVHVDAANDQHYEVPSEFFELMLGEHLKYSCGWWPDDVMTLDQAEEAMLRLTCQRADLQDGQDVLELGCGWGSLTLFMAARYPGSRITALSNSASQRDLILKRAHERGLSNVEVVTDDVADFTADFASFDRVVSVEMFEHVRNHHELFSRISSWLRPGGKVFTHVFAHRQWPYLFETAEEAGRAGRGGGDWMSRNFFTGGTMPSDDLFATVAPGTIDEPTGLVPDGHWIVSGEHYARTCQAWVERLDAHESEVKRIFADVYGRDRADAWFHRWRVFDLACLELFAFRGGTEWFVSHRRFAKA